MRDGSPSGRDAAGPPGLPGGVDPHSALVRAYVWGYPLVFAARLRQNMTLGSPPADEARAGRSAAAPINRFGHQRQLSDASYRVGVAPNVDTLYSVAWVDLADGPVVLDTPDFGSRYYTVQVGFADSSSLAVGRRTHGGRLPRVTLRLADTEPPATAGLHLTSPTRYAMLAGRILVDPHREGDAEQVHRLQDQLLLTRWQDGAPVGCTPSRQEPLDAGTEGLAEGPAFVRRLATVLADWATDTVPADVVADLRQAGFDDSLRLRRTVDPDLLQHAVAVGQALVADGVRTAATPVNGWAVNYRGSQFGDDRLLRASVAHSAIFVNPAAEALYPVAEVDAAGRRLMGSRRYQLTFAPGRLPPVAYFWSLTMYHEHGFLVENPWGRYAVGDRSAALELEPDGSLVIPISHGRPDARIANWLPAPAGGFRLMLRLYGPSADALSGRWAPPAVVALADTS